MRFGLLTQWYDPEPGPAALPGVLARGLTGRGHEVHVLTGIPNYPTGRVVAGFSPWRPTYQVDRGVHVHRVPLYPSHDAHMGRRVLNYASFGLTALAAAPWVFAGMDALWVNYSPITVGPAQWAAGRLRGVPSVVHVLDLWPDTIAASGHNMRWAGRVGTAALHRWCDATYAAADSIGYISPGVGAILRDRGVPEGKLHCVPMWADEDIFRPGGTADRSAWVADADTMLVLYAGSLGVAQNLQTLLDACAMLPPDAGLLVLIAGSGTEEASLRRQAADLRLTNVRFLGRVAPEDLTDLMATVDACYVSLNHHALSAVTLPSKTQATLAAGRAILAAAPGDLNDLVVTADAGWATADVSPTGIADLLRQMLAAGRAEARARGAHGRDHYRRFFSQDSGIRQIEAMLLAAAQHAPRRVPPRGASAADPSAADPSAADPPPDASIPSRDPALHYRALSAEDVGSAAQVHVAAFPGFFLSQLGEPFLREFYRGFLLDPSALTVVAEDADGQLVGLCVGTNRPNDFYWRLATRRFVHFAKAGVGAAFREPRIGPRLVRGLIYRGDAGGTSPGALLSSLCVHPGYGGRGVGQELLHRWSAEAAKVSDAAYLTTDADDNARVNRFYRASGWVLTGDFTTRESRHMHRYERRLR